MVRRVLFPLLVSTVAVGAHAQPTTQAHKLFSSGDPVGSGVAVSGSLGVVGARLIPSSGTTGGAFVCDTLSGATLTALVPADATTSNFAGVAVAIDGGVAIVGAHLDDTIDTNAGAAYLFDASNGDELAKLIPPTGVGANAHFGLAVAIADGLALVGGLRADGAEIDSGLACLFDAGTGALLHTFEPLPGAGTVRFGASVALDGGVAIVGAWADGTDGAFSGAVTLFDTTTGARLATLTPDDPSAGKRFGWSVAADDGVLVVGAVGESATAFEAGAAYVFDLSTQLQTHKLTIGGAAADDRAGESVAIHDGRALVGASGRGGTGAAVLFDCSSGSQIAELVASGGGAGDAFGGGVALGATCAIVCAPYDDEQAIDAGAAYIFLDVCEGDCNGSGDVAFSDLVAMLFEFGNASGGECDADGSGTVTFGDLVAALFLFGPCP